MDNDNHETVNKNVVLLVLHGFITLLVKVLVETKFELFFSTDIKSIELVLWYTVFDRMLCFQIETIRNSFEETPTTVPIHPTHNTKASI